MMVYILKSANENKTYVGITDDLERRLNKHNQGRNLYTKRYKPWKIIYTEEVLDRTSARKREKYYKSSAGRRWMMKNLF